MLIPSSTLSLLCLLLEVRDAYAVRMEGRRVTGGQRQLRRRSSAKFAGDFGSTGIANAQDVNYNINMTIGTEQRTVTIDTGSSDLWTIGTIEGGKSTGQSGEITYAQGSAKGPIYLTEIKFAGHKVSDQAYLNVTGGNPPQGDGLIGLGPFSSSVIRSKLNSAAGDPVLNRIFALNASTPNFMSFTLSRSEDTNQPFEAELTVGEYIEGLENITSTPKNPVQILPTSEQGSQHWSLNVDSITGPDGNEINVQTGVPKESKLVAVIDSGFSLPQVPKNISDAFYGRVNGAVFEENADIGSPAWVVPCDQILTASFTIGGVKYPIHPLDLVLNFNGKCYGSFQPSTITFADASSQFDMILGMAFLRNTYTLIDFGDFVDANKTEKEAPFIQLLSLTDETDAHNDFVNARLGGVDNTTDPQYALVPPEDAQFSPSRINIATPTAESTWDKIKHILIIVGIVVGGVVVLGILLCVLSCAGIISCCCGGRRRSVGFKGQETRQVYQPLNYPAPSDHTPHYGQHGTITHGTV